MGGFLEREGSGQWVGLELVPGDLGGGHRATKNACLWGLALVGLVKKRQERRVTNEGVVTTATAEILMTKQGEGYGIVLPTRGMPQMRSF